MTPEEKEEIRQIVFQVIKEYEDWKKLQEEDDEDYNDHPEYDDDEYNG
jgi:hypothetical protein